MEQTLPELVDDREGIFKRPRTKKDIFRDRQVLQIERFEDIVPTLERRTEHQAALILPNVRIIPVDESGNPQFYSAQNFSKRGQFVRLPTYGIQESMDKQWSSLKARIQASEDPQYKGSNEHFSYLVWRDQNGIYHIIQPWTVVEGRRLEMVSRQSKDIADKIEIVKEYNAKDSNLKNVLVKVPSRGEKRKRTVILEGLTSPEDPRRHVEWMRFSTRHSCGIKEGNFTFAFDKYATYCPHEVAAHVAYSRQIFEKTGKIIDQPFPLFREPMLRLYLSSIYDTMIAEADAKGKIKTRALTFPEINPILINGWLRYGNKHTLFVQNPEKHPEDYKAMRNYNWANSAPGMPFLPAKK